MARARWNFWLAWVAATVVGLLLGLALDLYVAFPTYRVLDGTVPASNLRDALGVAERAIGALGHALLLALAQAWVLRRVLGRVTVWVTAAAVGGLLAWFLTVWLGGHLLPRTGPPEAAAGFGVLQYCAGALVLATCLWLAVLRDRDPWALFVWASVAAAFVQYVYITPAIGISGLAQGDNVLLENGAFTFSHGLTLGALTGLALAFTVIRGGKPSKRVSSQRSRRNRPRTRAKGASAR